MRVVVRNPAAKRRTESALILLAMHLALVAGCFSERTVPMRVGEVQRVRVADTDGVAGTLSTRRWLEIAHAQLASHLPREKPTALLTNDLVTPDGSPVDVFRHFGVDPSGLHTLLGNWFGLMYTAQAAGSDASGVEPPAWAGFRDVWIPVRPGYELMGRLGLAEQQGRPIRADCIIILPGLFGDLQVVRTRELAEGLRRLGYHVLAMESRGFGQTGARYPDVAYTFGVLETSDLIAAAEWLQARPEVRETGLLGFCWGANGVLMAACQCSPGDKATAPELAAHMRPPPARPLFRAGVIACSPVLRVRRTVAACEEVHPMLENPVLHAIESSVRDRMVEKGYPDPSGRLRALIEDEFAASELDYPGAVEQALDWLELIPSPAAHIPDKLGRVQVPVLIVQGVNDALAPAQDVADLLATTGNPNIAAVILPNGGHIGFAPYARSYFYSLIVSFFDYGAARAGSGS